MITFAIVSTIFLVGIGCGVLVTKAGEHDRTRQKLREDEADRRAFDPPDTPEAPGPYRRRLKHVDPPSFERAPAPVTEGVIALAKQLPAKAFRFQGTCSRCGSFRVYELGDVDDNDNYVKCNACDSRRVFHFAHNRIKD